jgi:hypothetical protein
MISKRNTGRVFGLVLALFFGSLLIAFIHQFYPTASLPVMLLIGLAVYAAFYLAGVWAVVDRPAELDEKIPLSSNERRRRKKQFYDWLDSLGPR